MFIIVVFYIYIIYIYKGSMNRHEFKSEIRSEASISIIAYFCVILTKGMWFFLLCLRLFFFCLKNTNRQQQQHCAEESTETISENISVHFFQEHLFMDFFRKISVRRTDTLLQKLILCVHRNSIFQEHLFFGYRIDTDFPKAPF